MVHGRIIAERSILSLGQMQSSATEQAATLSAPCTLARSGWLCANKPPFWRIRQGKTAQQLFVLLFGLRDANRRRLVRDKTVQELFPGWLHAAISPTPTLAHILHPQTGIFYKMILNLHILSDHDQLPEDTGIVIRRMETLVSRDDPVEEKPVNKYKKNTNLKT